ncbi:ATP-dependent zinc metalloprotease FtsH 4 [Maioricimonas rarisocia]|uniref:ATP-dependent zinc metalloprotease FtsH n=1 Tax=Maioricimonas rarisocia TaxID=2528026 RepID=A0A517ZA10_9PLAN|nr:ATP-dependent zinc metalloprotease FtsH [Maioricimonas rarisocia]QDU39281.1 ATP-dependent zinc metalloprotease FtsH 4 [Maioricimonas rarisocia]
MTDPDPSPRNDSSQDPSRRPSGAPRRDRNPAGNSLWYVLIFCVLGAVAISVYRGQTSGKELTFSEFEAKVRSGEFNKDNVHELTFGQQYLTFQDQPKGKSLGIDSEDAAEPSGETAADDPQAPEGEEQAAAEEPAEEAPAQSSDSVQRYRVAIGFMPEASLAELDKLLRERGIQVKSTTIGTQWESVIYFVFMILLIVVVITFFRRMGGAGSAMSFGRSRGRLVAEDDIKVTFDDVAGIEEAVEELREVVEFLRTPSKYQALGGRIPRGVLLVGPPGTGKTLLAKAVAGEAGVPFFSLSGSDFVEMFVGVGAARVRDMFAQAVQRSPSIIFIDELDALGKVRGSGMPGGHDEREQTLNALLVEMDGFSSDQSVIVMGATNRPETLDPALMRPGRFDRHVLVDRPDYKGREAILKVHSAKIKLDDNVDLGRLAKLTPGFVGADLANLVNEAALLAARKNKSAASMAEFEEGVERVIAGLEKSTRIIHEDEKQRVAYHECGHALVACSLPHTDPVHKISIIPRGMGALGYTLQRPEDDRHLVTQTELQNRICVLLGGISAEELVYNETSTGAQNDLERATDIARRMVTEFGMSPKLGRVNYQESRRSMFLGNTMTMAPEYTHSADTVREIDLEVKRIVDECMQTADDVLKTQRDALEAMTRELIEIEVMDADRLAKILDAHRTGPQIKPGTFVSRTGGEAPESQQSDTDESSRKADGGA